MKPRIFIGSSVEGLDVANAIQANLEYDATPTVWTQGIFQLSNNTLDDLIKALGNFDFAIFVFKPDDFIEIRNTKHTVVRDNVIFELGLFIGRLGKDRVFFIVPNDGVDFHLPTDLLGITAGKYNSKREDGNLQAALGPFCTQVREILREFNFQNLVDLANEDKTVKRIALEKKPCWEMHLCAALLRPKMEDVNRSFDEVMKGYIFRKTSIYNPQEVITWFRQATTDLGRIVQIATKVYNNELSKAFGEPGVEGSIFEIKSVCEKIYSLCKELVAWEIDVQSISVPDEIIEFKEIQSLMKGWTSNIISEFTRLPTLLEKSFSPENIAKGELIEIMLTFTPPPNEQRITRILNDLEAKARRGAFKYILINSCDLRS